MLAGVGEAVGGPHLRHHLERLGGLGARVGRLDAEEVPLGDGGAGETELDAAAAEVVEGGGAFGDPDRVVEAAGCEHGGVAEADAGGLLGQGGEHQLRRGGQAELAGAVVLDLPPAAVAELVGEAGLFEGLAEAELLGGGAGILDLVEQVDLHRHTLTFARTPRLMSPCATRSLRGRYR